MFFFIFAISFSAAFSANFFHIRFLDSSRVLGFSPVGKGSTKLGTAKPVLHSSEEVGKLD